LGSLPATTHFLRMRRFLFSLATAFAFLGHDRQPRVDAPEENAHGSSLTTKLTQQMFVQSEAEARSSSDKLHVGAHARGHAFTVDLPKLAAQQELCSPRITVCLPCDGADEADTRVIPRVLDSIAEQTCLPGKVILAASGISEQQSAELLAGLMAYKERFPLQILAKKERLHAGLNRNRCALAADTEVVSFFDVDDIMHPRRLEFLSFAFGNYHPKAVVHAYEESPKSMCDKRAPAFRSRDLGTSLQIFDGIGIYDKSMSQDAERNNFLVTPNSRGVNHAGHISVLRSLFSEVQQTDMARGQDSRFARDILKHWGRHEDTMECLNAPLSLYCHQWKVQPKKHIHGDGFVSVNDTKRRLHQRLRRTSNTSA
jgi:hypothetical protein